MKKTNAKSRPLGGVNKDIRVKPKMAALEFDVTPRPKKVVEEDDFDDEPIKKKKKKVVDEEDEPVKKKKKKVVAEDDDEPVKKKKKKRTPEEKARQRSAIMLMAQEGPKKISKLKTKGMRSIFGDNAEKILQLLETNETDSAVASIYKATLSSLVDLLPYAEHAIRKSKGARGVYQINSLISSMRELMVDIQSAQDRGMMGQALMDQVMRPTFSDMAQDVVQEYGMIAADAKNGMTEKEYGRFRTALMESRARLADKITKHYRSINDQTISYLQR